MTNQNHPFSKIRTAKEVDMEEATKAGLSYIDSKGDLRGYCYCCGRAGFKLDAGGGLSRHGFTRPRWMGYTTGACWGTKMTPEQTLDAAIKTTTERVDWLKERLSTDLVREAVKRMYFVHDYRGAHRRRLDNASPEDRKGFAQAIRDMRNGEYLKYKNYATMAVEVGTLEEITANFESLSYSKQRHFSEMNLIGAMDREAIKRITGCYGTEKVETPLAIRQELTRDLRYAQGTLDRLNAVKAGI